jgi:hypothetical protein
MTRKRAATNLHGSGKGGVTDTYIILDGTVSNDMRSTFPRRVLMILTSFHLACHDCEAVAENNAVMPKPPKAGSASSKSLPLNMLVKQ